MINIGPVTTSDEAFHSRSRADAEAAQFPGDSNLVAATTMTGDFMCQATNVKGSISTSLLRSDGCKDDLQIRIAVLPWPTAHSELPRGET